MPAMTNAELEALALSLEVALRSVLFSLPLAVATAWLLTRRRFAGRTMLDAFVHLPMVLPPVMVGYVLLLLFGVRGPVGAWLYQTFGIRMAFTTRGAASSKGHAPGSTKRLASAWPLLLAAPRSPRRSCPFR